MNRSCRYQAILFDMDNTLLKSTIDFPRIKRDVFAQVTEAGLLPASFPIHEHTIATLIESARSTDGFTVEHEAAVWDTVVAGEREGMVGAELESHVPEVLERLRERVRLSVLTNNAREAAIDALERTGIASYFDHIAGREQMTALKPSPSGIAHIMSRYPDIHPEQWLSVGDSWIDGKAAQSGGIAFLAYNARIEELKRRQIPFVGHIRSMHELFDFL
ncbi:HAD family hydrolase [Paenibacillus mesophilus]|uniref:HAD family hydrolase n=1 Tax=Paenibacillus mesophilus TaxID=2582849 RepID=UPI00110E10D7|nr:HAD-IA family hydrolase [Paenibacillus mesophilus]TMV51977.1 HAD family hydrolase [Paenibacillus mesophilus]